MTFAVLRALHHIIGEALDDIQRTYNPELPQSNTGGSSSGPGSVHSEQAHSDRSVHGPYASPPPSPSTAAHPTLPLDFPSLDAPYDPSDPAEQLTTDPAVLAAINRIVAAAGQMAATVQLPFLSICDASMAYHLPSCMRLLEASHTVEILREAGPSGLHVDEISAQNGVERARLAHILRFLATHHILKECRPNVFAINRISSLLDSGKSLAQIKISEKESRPELKYHGSDGIAAFVGLSTDELFKASAYMTEAYLLSRSRSPRAPFQYAFATNSPYFEWLEGEKVFSSSDSESNHGSSGSDGVETGPGTVYPAVQGPGYRLPTDTSLGSVGGWKHQDSSDHCTNPNKFRLERFGKAMSGTGSWEAPGAILSGFDWAALPRGSVIVDVGGGIGSTSMLLASAFSRAGQCEANETEAADLDFKFIIQDRPVVVKMGEKAWRTNCPEFLDSGVAEFQVHDFFTPQPIRNAAVFLLRVIMHDWPDAQARKILLRLREAATDDTKLLLADFILPLACVDDAGGVGGVLEGIEGADAMLASAPLLANLGKASTHVYCMDLTMQATFNSKERTLHETVSIASSAGWKVVKVSHAVGSLFSYIVAVPAPIPTEGRIRSGSSSAHGSSTSGGRSETAASSGERLPGKSGIDLIERASSRCGTPTFGSQMELPSIRDAIKRFGGGSLRARGIGLFSREGTKRPLPQQPPSLQKSGMLKQPIVLSSPVKKKRPSPLSLQPPLPAVSTSSSPSSAMLASLRPSVPSSPIRRRMSLAQLSSRSREGSNPSSPGPRQTIFPQPPASPMSPRPPTTPTLSRRTSYAHITAQGGTGHTSLAASSVSPAVTAVPVLPFRPVPTTPSAPSKQYRSPSPHPRLARRMSHAQLGSVGMRGASISNAALLAPSSIPTRQPPPPPPPVPQDHLRQLQQPFPPLPQTPSQSNERASAHAHHPSLTLSSRPGHGTTPVSGVPIIANSPVASRNPPLPRRSSFAQLRQTSLRTRTGSIAGLSALTLSENGQGGPGSGRGARPEPFLPRSGSYSGDGKRVEPPEESPPVSQGSVLAAAARIEHGSGRVQRSS